MPPIYLPHELWLEIFQWAAYSDSFYVTQYQPFDTSPEHDIDQSLKVKFTLVRVCRQWRAMAEDLLYQDVRIRHGDQTLAKTLASSELRAGWVRRAELPYANTATASRRPLTSLAILKRCPELQILVRPAPDRLDNLHFEFDADGLQLTSLRRLEWWYHNEAARSGGINCLDDVLSCSPNLQYLSLGGELRLNQLKPPRHLQGITMLRLRWMNALFVGQICRWTLPSLVHLVVENCHSASVLEMLWVTFGSQIEVIELGKHLRFYIQDYIAAIIRGCSNLHELNYYIHFTAPPYSEITHSSLRCIRLHGHSNFMASEANWVHISKHFALFSGPTLSHLRRVILYGEWRPVLCDHRFAEIHLSLLARGCSLETSDGAKVELCHSES